jgi:hypothetical protein
MKHLNNFDGFKFNESHATFKPGSLIEFHIPNRLSLLVSICEHN